MATHKVPPHNVHLGQMDVEARYEELIADLDRFTPTPQSAAKVLGRLLIGPERYDEVVRQGDLGDSNHELRALIAIIRGDQRPMGQIYDEIRSNGAEEWKPLATDVNKAEGVVRNYDPLAERRSYSF